MNELIGKNICILFYPTGDTSNLCSDKPDITVVNRYLSGSYLDITLGTS